MDTIRLEEKQRAEAIASLRRYWEETMGEPVGELRAGLLLDFFLEEIGPLVYNQAIGDAQAQLTAHVADLEGELYADAFQYWARRAGKKK